MPALRLAGPHRVVPFGDAQVDGCLPRGTTGDGQPGAGLPLGQAHEILAEGIEAETGGLAAAFAACWLARLPQARPGETQPAQTRPIIWIAPSADLYPPGLLAYGLNPARLLLVQSADDAATLAAMETALRGGAAAAVVGEAGRLSRLAGRRLHLACLARGCTGFLLRRWPYGARPSHAAVPVATRWRVTSLPSEPALRPAHGRRAARREPGPPRWRMELLHARGGRPGEWVVELQGGGDAPVALRVVAGLADAAAAPLRRRA